MCNVNILIEISVFARCSYAVKYPFGFLRWTIYFLVKHLLMILQYGFNHWWKKPLVNSHVNSRCLDVCWESCISHTKFVLADAKQKENNEPVSVCSFEAERITEFLMHINTPVLCIPDQQHKYNFLLSCRRKDLPFLLSKFVLQLLMPSNIRFIGFIKHYSRDASQSIT